jgi:arginase
LELLISGLVSSPSCVGIEITVFDPDYDPDGVYARDVADTLVAGLAPLVHDEAVPSSTARIVPTQRVPESEMDAGVRGLD